ncbi:TMEM175 family protein [Nocardioides mesophilus]|uniref:DUF1211 domain-containing protein n=1 Tax=Nocardioides mesophilus TaxID=433659 RepID=A0A7G9R896_9ACTN|nr:TMEM175 family protein [Nocardioides mesophilus]QNN51821.1 DUF1211 domain-containing protein [Nocardioides mesophilus]
MSDRAAPEAGASRLLPKARLEAFSDGVFAIVVTLLVLELDVPKAEEPLLPALADSWPAYLGYFVSFTFIGGAWIAHSNMTRFIKCVDASFMRLNLLLLLFVSFLPFTTNLLAVHLNDAEEGGAVVIFGTNLTLAALLVNSLVAYAARTPGLAADDVAEEELQVFAKERRAALLLQAVATVVGLFLPVIAVMVFLAISVLLLVDPLWRARRRKSEHARTAAQK